MTRDDLNGANYHVNDDTTPAEDIPARSTISDFIAYLPEHRYIYRPTGALWPKESVNSAIPYKITNPETGRRMKPSDFLDEFQSVVQMTWAPGHPEVIGGRLLQDGGWSSHRGAQVYNLYRPPNQAPGEADNAVPWIVHLKKIYPDDAEHITRWLAHRIQKPHEKINHALVLGGKPGIGKDTLLDPVKFGIGAWNWSEISPRHMLGRFNGWVKSVVVRMNEAHDLGEFNKFALYDTSKTYIAAPPDVLRIDEKNVREYAVFNVLGLIITSNNRLDGLYLPADDRRHYVAWSEAEAGDFSESYWRDLWYWYEETGYADVAAYLRAYDLSGFDAKAQPRKTPAFWNIVAAGESGEPGEMRDVTEAFGNGPVTVEDLIKNADRMYLHDLANELRERKNRTRIPHMLLKAGYVSVRNPDTNDGLWVVNGKRIVIYCRQQMPFVNQVSLAKARCLPAS
jgi:hypothetical protein